MRTAHVLVETEGNLCPCRLNGVARPKLEIINKNARKVVTALDPRNFGPKGQRCVRVSGEIQTAQQIGSRIVLIRRSARRAGVTNGGAIGCIGAAMRAFAAES